AECGHAEVKLGELAQKQASSDKVKEFARQMVAEHTLANNKLAERSRNLKLAYLAGTDPEKKATYNRLAQLKGADFDREYMKQMVEDHEKAVQLFEAEAKSKGDAELRQFAENALPKLKAHLKRAREVYEGVGGKDK